MPTIEIQFFLKNLDFQLLLKDFPEEKDFQVPVRKVLHKPLVCLFQEASSCQHWLKSSFIGRCLLTKR